MHNAKNLLPLRIAAAGDRERKQLGFTLLELLVVLAILGLLIGLVAPAALRQLGSAEDPWGRPFIYRNPSQRQGHEYDLLSLGPTGQPGGTGETAAIVNE